MDEQTFTIHDALRLGAERLALREDLHQTATPDARQLLEIATGRTRVQMLTRPETVLTAEDLARYNSLLAQRMEAVPVQYLRGSQDFYGRDFRVSPAVLIPRPETEDIIDAALELTPDRQRPVRIADVGTGSGVIALTLALELPQSHVLAVDISGPALDVARDNAARLAARYDQTLADRLHFVQSDLLDAVSGGSCFDLVVSNPPYIPENESATLHAQVREHEPHLALFGGVDGHDILRRLISQAHDMIVPGGLLILETAGRTDLLDRLLGKWSNVRYRRDLREMERIVVAQRP